MACLWDINAGHALGALAGHDGAVCAVSLCNTRIVTASVDGTAKVWDSRTLGCVATLAGHTSVVRVARHGGDVDPTVLTGGDDGTVRVWDLRAQARGSRLTLTGEGVCVAVCVAVCSLAVDA